MQNQALFFHRLILNRDLSRCFFSYIIQAELRQATKFTSVTNRVFGAFIVNMRV